jgi:hypothetical protein
MALTTTYVNGAVSATPTGKQIITLAAYTAPSVGAIGALKMLRFATGEYCLITDDSNSPTLEVVRGWNGSRVLAHAVYEGVQYGLSSDTAWPAGPAAVTQIAPVMLVNAQEVTLTGTSGTDAAVVTVPSPAILNCSGASGAGVNLPVPSVGMSYVVKNSSSGTMKIYCVGGSLNGTTGTTAVSMTTTGTLGDQWFCATSGAWQGAPTSV